MSATSFLRQRRKVALAYLEHHIDGRHKDRVAAILAENNLTPADLSTLDSNTDILSIVDKIEAEISGFEDLDHLEELNTVEVGDRAAVHSSDVRADQFEDRLQHPSQETVGVGNMHDGPQAAEDIANVGALAVENAGGLAEAARIAADESALSDHALPPGAPTPLPVEDNQLTAEDGQPTDPNGVNTGGETVVDRSAAADQLADEAKTAAKLEKLGEASLSQMDRDQLLEYADKQQYRLANIKPGTTPATIAKQILAIQEKN